MFETIIVKIPLNPVNRVQDKIVKIPLNPDNRVQDKS